MKIASLCIPHVGGPYAFADNLRRFFSPQGIQLRWIGVGRKEQQAVRDPRFSPDLAFGEVTAAGVTVAKDQACELVRHLEEQKYDAVIIHVLGGQVQANIARYLPPQILRIVAVHSISRGTYAYARAIRDYVHAAVGASPRIRRDLVRSFGFPSGNCHHIPYGIELQRFSAPRRAGGGAELRILSLGRIENQSKGVFLIPEILRRLGDVRLQVTIAGEGPDLAELKRRMSGISIPVDFAGFVPNERVPGLYREHDLMLMPSHYEGFPFALMEAMAAGCVPVVSRIRLVTDQMVEPGVTGWLFKPGDAGEAASIVRQAYSDRGALRRMSEAATQKALTDYSSDLMGVRYTRLVRALFEDPPPIRTPLSLSDWGLPSGIRPGVSGLVPSSLKPLLRKCRERLFYSW